MQLFEALVGGRQPRQLQVEPAQSAAPPGDRRPGAGLGVAVGGAAPRVRRRGPLRTLRHDLSLGEAARGVRIQAIHSHLFRL